MLHELCTECLNSMSPSRYTMCRSCYRRYQNKLHLADPRKRMFNNARQRARQKGQEFDLTLNDIVIPERCPVLDVKLEVWFKLENQGSRQNSPSLDRIDNSIGYVSGNVRVISWKANTLKGTMSLEDIRRLAQYMETHHPAGTLFKQRSK